jgi:hypothetical protein
MKINLFNNTNILSIHGDVVHREVTPKKVIYYYLIVKGSLPYDKDCLCKFLRMNS